MTNNVILYHNVSLNILVKMLMDATDMLSLQHHSIIKNTVRKQSIQIYHESVIREYSNIENAIWNANFINDLNCWAGDDIGIIKDRRCFWAFAYFSLFSYVILYINLDYLTTVFLRFWSVNVILQTAWTFQTVHRSLPFLNVLWQFLSVFDRFMTFFCIYGPFYHLYLLFIEYR